MRKIDYLTFLQEEIATIKSRFQPEDTGHLRTTVNVLTERVEEVKEELRQLEELMGKGDLT
tara:strand:- start:312 stop:494 length:183 start_codon:yes stop_codon:yes gene_type:complete